MSKLQKYIDEEKIDFYIRYKIIDFKKIWKIRIGHYLYFVEDLEAGLPMALKSFAKRTKKDLKKNRVFITE